MKKIIFLIGLILGGVALGEATTPNKPIAQPTHNSKGKPTASWKMRLAQKIITKIQTKIAKRQAKQIKKGKQTTGFKMKWGWFVMGILSPLFLLLILSAAIANASFGTGIILAFVMWLLVLVPPLITSIVKKNWDIFLSALLGWLSFSFLFLILALLASGGTS